jgi:hypothetical protein
MGTAASTRIAGLQAARPGVRQPQESSLEDIEGSASNTTASKSRKHRNLSERFRNQILNGPGRGIEAWRGFLPLF